MVVGIVAEYNPFHNGHKLQIDYAKNELGATQVVVAMSGSFTQRGEIACFDKYTRAHAALICGADIVFEMPTIFATASAREFAAAGVQLLASTGVVDTILFGAENDDVDLFKSSAKRLVELEKSGVLDSKIKEIVATGETYAYAHAHALADYIPIEIKCSPNNLLGLEYCRYIYEHDLNMDIAILKRQGNDYNDVHLTGEICSATAVRAQLSLGKEITAVPEVTIPIYKGSVFVSPDDIAQMLHYKLLSENDFEKYLDCTSDLADRIKNLKKDYINFTSFSFDVNTKNITFSRASRVLCHILLDITQEAFEAEKAADYIRYLRMLGFSKNGAKLLAAIKERGCVPLITSPTDIIDKHDIYAADIHRAIVTAKTSTVYPNEFTRKFDLANI
ncbi:MAG: nucleotidyltransferase family protein [Pseudobutyrivibrio sp.]|nr:nucleotidyltransferase family protein [Pseudobutyrivibrio sp.]